MAQHLLGLHGSIIMYLVLLSDSVISRFFSTEVTMAPCLTYGPVVLFYTLCLQGTFRLMTKMWLLFTRKYEALHKQIWQIYLLQSCLTV